MKIVRVWKVIAVFLLCTGQTFCTSAAIYDETSDPTNGQVLRRSRRTLVGAGGGGLRQMKPETPFPVRQNPIVPVPQSFSLTINFSRNNKSVFSDNYKLTEVGATAATRAPTTQKTTPTTTKPSPPKSFTKITTPIQTKTVYETTPDPPTVRHFRKLTKPKKNSKTVTAVENTTNNEEPVPVNNDVVEEVDDTETPEINDLPTENVEFFTPLDEITTTATDMNLRSFQEFVKVDETTVPPVNNLPQNPFRTILSRDWIPQDVPVNSDTVSPLKAVPGRDRMVSKGRKPKTMATLRKARKKGKNS